jgi:hypothetical protein
MDELRIIKYLDGEMPGEELRAFEEEIRMNPPLAEEVRKYRQIQDLAGKLLGNGEREPEAGLQGEDPDPEMRENALDPAIEQEISEAVGEFKKDPSSCGQVPGEYRETLAQAGKAFFENRGKTGAIRMIRRIWYTAAAVVVLAVTVSILILKPFEKIPAGEVYAQYFRTFHKTDQILNGLPFCLKCWRTVRRSGHGHYSMREVRTCPSTSRRKQPGYLRP